MKTVKLMALAITLTVTLSLTAQQSNESIVRETYAKLMFANQVEQSKAVCSNTTKRCCRSQ